MSTDDLLLLGALLGLLALPVTPVVLCVSMSRGSWLGVGLSLIACGTLVPLLLIWGT